MSLSSFFRRHFRRKENEKNKADMLWVELQVPEALEPVDKKILSALAGKGDPFAAEDAIAEFLAYGWERIKNEVYAFFTGKKPCLQLYLRRILDAYPEETERMLGLCFNEMPNEQRLIFLGATCGNDPQRVAEEVKRILPELEIEELGIAFSVLATYPSDTAEALLCSYLKQEDWRLKMKAASALMEGKYYGSVEKIRQAALQCDATVKAGLELIAKQMEGK